MFQAVTRDEVGEALGVAAQRRAGNRAYWQGEAVRTHRQSRFSSFPDRIQFTKTELRMQFGGFADFRQLMGVIVYALPNHAPALEAFLS